MEEIKNSESKKKCCCLKFGFWQIIAVVVFILFVFSLLTGGFGLNNVLNKYPVDKISQEAIKFINENLLAGESSASLISSSCLGKVGLCKITIKINEREYNSYVSTDGNLLFPDTVDVKEFLAQKNSEAEQEAARPVAVPKQDKPEVQLFVMSYCPYGLQTQKALLPAYDLLKDEADIKIRFVNYAMHGKKELDENLTQYCAQKNEPEKFSQYLTCFVQSANSDSAGCLTAAKINKTKLASCVSATDDQYQISAKYEDQSTWLSGQYPLFGVDGDLNTQYSVSGSPTIVINGQVVNVNPRSPENFKSVICQAFNSAPEQCSQVLSTATPVPGFGSGETASSNSGECE